MPRRLTKEEFIAKARIKHGDKYDYSKSEYANSKQPIYIICYKHGGFWQIPSDHLNGSGCPECGIESHKKLVYEHGINDVSTRSNNKVYKTWVGMLERCYSPKYHLKEPPYLKCIVCAEWRYFSKFKEWFEDSANGYQEGYELDKDILVKGNKVYSPNTCCFVPQELNKLLMLRKSKRGKLPIGVAFTGFSYRVQISLYGKRACFGRFSTPEVAFLAYKKAKEQYVKELAEKYYKEGKITERVYNALLDYRVEITD